MGKYDLILMTKYVNKLFYHVTPLNAYGDIDEYMSSAAHTKKRKKYP